MTQETQNSVGDRALARAILQVDVAGAKAALEAGATAHRTPFRDISWALLPVCVSLQRRGPFRAITEDVRTMMRTLLQDGAPTTGIVSLLDAGVRFGHEDVILCLDHWLQRDVEGRKQVLQMLGDDDAMMCALVDAEHVRPDLVMSSGLPILHHALERDMVATVHALCAAGADPNARVLHSSLGDAPVIEAAVRDGRLRTAMALLVSGAAYDRARLEQCAAAHSEAATRTLYDCIDAVEKGKVRNFVDLLELPSLKFFADALSAATPAAKHASRVAHMAAIESSCVAFTETVAKWDLAAG